MTSVTDLRRRLADLKRRLSRRELTSHDVDRLLALAVSLLAGLAVFFLATRLFPYHSSNDDEAVYLLQAAMLLEGQLEIHAGELADAVRPWFFVDDGGRLYPKYTPVPAAMYAVSMAVFGEPRVTLAVVAAGNTALTYVLGSTVFDRRVGLLAAACFAASPLALITSSVFLPYAPTTFLNLLFAVLYLRGVREGSLPSAAGAGVAIGLAFFARPYTAVLFATPFILHALVSIGHVLRREGISAWLWADPIRRNALTAAGGLAFVGITLAYNARVTGSPLLFPYEAFAPLDGPGFGYREINGYSREYTVDVALEANRYVLWYYATRWFTAGPIGTLAALSGLALALRRWVPAVDDHGRTAGLVLAGTLVTVPLGNLAFWGNLNVLATLDDPTNGLLAQFGPFYHFDLLVPLSIFAAFAAMTGWRRLSTALAARTSSDAVRGVALAALVSSLLLVGAVNAAVVSAPVERNAEHTERFESAYEPFEDADVDDALVFLPAPYGDWLNHPFQYLRNDPDLDGEAVYALGDDPEGEFDVIDAYPDRTLYRYAYHGEWTPTPTDRITPTLDELEIREGERVEGEMTVGILDRVDYATVRLETDSGEYASHASYAVIDPGSTLTVEWAAENGSAELVAVDGGGTNEPVENATVDLEGTDVVDLSVTQVQEDGSSLTYRQEATVRATEEGLEVLWPAERSVCTLVTRCDDGTYVPDESDLYVDGVSFETRLEAE